MDRKRQSEKKSQFWYIDFITGMLIFVCGFLIFVFYTNNVMDTASSSSLDSISVNTAKISELLFSKGSPEKWDSDSFEIPGIICNDETIEICPKKMMNLFNSDYNKLKNSFGTRFDFHIYFSWINETDDEKENITVISFGDHCGINTNGTIDGPKKNAIYTDSFNSFIGYSNPFGITNIYNSSNINSFFSDLDSYQVILLYNPDISKFTQTEKEMLRDFVFSGKVLIASGNISSEFLELNFTGYDRRNLISRLDAEKFESVFNRHSYLVPESTISISGTEKIAISNPYLKEKLDNKNSNNYRYMINSNVSEIMFLHTISYNNSIIPTVIFERYGLGRFYYFNDISNNQNFSVLVNETIKSLDIRSCKVQKSALIDEDYRSVSKITRIGKIYGKIVRMTVISYEK